LHAVNVTIWDEEGLRDWQEVKVFVRDLPKAIANGSNNFSDIGNGNASVEDPYILDASLSYSIIGELADEFMYYWHETVEPIIIETSHLTTILPHAVPYSILDILDYVFNTSELNGDVKRESTITLSVGLIMDDGSIVYGEPDYMYLNVSQCLPHVNADNPYNPYPYNLTTGFQATHACCGNGTEGYLWGERKNYTAICYNVTEHAALKYFIDNYDPWYAGYLDEANDLTHNGYLPPIGDDNDVYTRNFSRYCDGTRGNICNGSGVYDLVVADNCESTLLSHQAESCYGPPKIYFTTPGIGENADECIIYSAGDTFEELNNGEDNTRACSDGFACYGVVDLADNPIFKDSGLLQYRTATSVGDSGDIIGCDQAFCTGGSVSDDLGNCAKVKGADCSCSSACNPDITSDCNNEDPGFDLGSNTWCNISCTVQECGFYNFDSSNTYSCFSECGGYQDCFDDGSGTIFCDRPTSTPNRECLKCYNDGTGLQEGGINGVEKCEMACDDTEQDCDEEEQGALASYNFGAGCNKECAFFDCGNFRFDDSTFTCFESCTTDNHCKDYYECQITTGNCVFGGT
jgi:hypothetical protein